jgi:hypothetical protein
MRDRSGGMEKFQVGDWVRTKDGHDGKVVFATHLTAFVEIDGHNEMRARPFLA